MKAKTQKIIPLLFSQFMVAAYGVAALYLYYRQIQWVDGAVYESDLPAHIKMATETGGVYSLTALLYRILWSLPGGDCLIALVLALFTVGSVFGAAALLGKLDPERDRMPGFYLLAGLLLNLVMPCYIKGFSDGRYIGMQSPSIWHNSTYIVMKCCAIWCMILYLTMEEEIRNGIKKKDWLVFTLALLVTTGVKPSFLVAFAPMMLVILISDLVGGVPFKRLFFFGCSVLPSLGVILLQNALLFGTDSGNSVALIPGQAIAQHTGYPLIVTVLSLFFPLAVAFFHIKKMAQVKWYYSLWIMTAVGFLEYFLLAETGSRSSDGNFLWGYSVAIFLLFLGSLRIWLEDFDARKWAEGNWFEKAGMICCGILLIWHLYCGVYFFSQLVQGTSYWMWT